MDIIRTEHPVAKKQHICCVCGCPIEPGTRYFLQVNTYGGFCVFKGHEECVDYDANSRDPYDEGSDPDGTECWVIDDLTDILGTREAAWGFRHSHTLHECVKYIQKVNRERNESKNY